MNILVGGMRTVLDRWGNSLGVRLPKGIAESAGLQIGDAVDVAFQDGTITIKHARPRYALAELLEGMTPDTVHPEVDWGEPVGAETLRDVQ